MPTRQWAVTTDGTFDFNDPNNWVFGTVPSIFDVAQFNQFVSQRVTGNATIAELQILQGTIDLMGSYTMSGAQFTELAISSSVSELAVDPGASIFGTGNIVVDGGFLLDAGTI